MKITASILFLSISFSCLVSQVSNVSSSTISMNINGSVVRIPYYRNLAISSGSTVVTHAAIMIHGTDRNADDYYNTLADAAQFAGKTANSLLIAPQFLMEEDINAHTLNNEYLFWTNDGWKNGSNSLTTTQNPRPVSISSYAVLDTIIYRISKNFPNLKTIHIAGHSAGGQVVSRYVAANSIDGTIPQCIRYVVANPSSYLYFNGERKKTGTLNQFAMPSSSEINACPDYNDWKYGFGNLSTECPYANAAGNTLMTNRFQSRETVFMIGGSDNDPNNSSLDKSCAGMMQGDHRFERANVYYNYIKYYFGSSITTNHLLDTVPGVAHNNYNMFTSAEGLKYLFNTLCTPVTTGMHRKPGSKIRIYTEGNGKICVEAPMKFTIEMHSITGQLLLKKECFGKTELQSNHSHPQLYIIRITSGMETVVQKILN